MKAAGEVTIDRPDADQLDLARHTPWIMLFVAWATQTFVFLSLQAPATIAPLIQDDLGISRAEVGLFASAFSLGGLVSVMPAGWLVDRVGSRWLLCFGSLLAGAAFALSSRSGVFWLMILLVLLAGVGAGMVNPAATKAVMIWFTPRTRGTAMGIKQTGTPLGGAIAAAVLPSLALGIGWREASGLAGLWIVVIGVMALLVFRDKRSAVSAATIKSRQSLRRLLADRNLQLCSVAAVCFTAAQMSAASYLVLYFKESLAMPMTVAGALLAVAQMSGVASRIVLGLISDRLLGGRRKALLVAIGAISVLCALALALLASSLPFPILIVVVVVFGSAVMGWTGLLLVLVAELVGKESTGLGSSVATMACNLGVVVGPPFFGFLVDQTQSYVVAWSVAALLSGIGALATQYVREANARPIAAGSPT